MARRIGRLHVLTDTVLQTTRTHVELAQMAAAGGAEVVQFRHKPAADRQWLRSIATAMRQAMPQTVQLVIDDHVDVAQGVAGAGVHLGPADASPQEARRLLGTSVVIGATANSLREARRLFDEPIDYLGVGPVFGTTSKAQPAAPLGLESLQEIAAASPLPVIAIGGIQPQDIAALVACGAYGVAILSGAVCQADVVAAVGAYRDALRQALSAPGVTDSLRHDPVRHDTVLEEET